MTCQFCLSFGFRILVHSNVLTCMLQFLNSNMFSQFFFPLCSHFKIYSYIFHLCCCCSVAKLCPTLPPHGLAIQAPLSMGFRILEWVAIASSRRFPPPRDWTPISCIGRHILYHWATGFLKMILFFLVLNISMIPWYWNSWQYKFWGHWSSSSIWMNLNLIDCRK